MKISRSTIYPNLASFSVFPFLPLFHLVECLSRYMCGHNFTMNFPSDFHKYTERACGFLLLIYHYFTKQIDFRLQTSLICKNNDNNKNIMQEKVARRCSTKKLSLKLHKICGKISVLESLSNTVKGLQVIRLATLLKRNPRSSVLEPTVRECSLK